MTPITKIARRPAFKILTALRTSKAAPIIIKGLVKLHNFSYHQIAFFSSRPGYHPKHDIQQYEKFFLKHISSTSTVLDVGCGKGQLAYALAGKVASVVGVDISDDNIGFAEKKYKRGNLKFIAGDGTSYEFNQMFDVVVLSNVLEHIQDRTAFLTRLAQVAPVLLIRVPMITRDWISVYKKNQGLEYRLDETHFIEYDRQSFAAEMKLAKLAIKSIDVDFGEIYAVVTRNQDKT